ncbi:MAG TPA: protein kinase [Myxococcaceae bacterium]|nr:protein kinase [Myxococcaceae bacterium]
MNCARCRQPVEENRKFCGKCGAPTASRGRAGDEPTIVPVRVNDLLEGKWRLERKLGEGGMGTVYLAHDLQLDRKVAIKILASSLAGDAELVTRFEREARLTASLEHPHVVPVYAVGEVEGRPFIVMKKLEGRTLAAYLRESGPLRGDELMALMRQLCSGLDFIHARGFIHRDIKSGNIFIGHDGLATILDFGILRTSQNAEALTRTGMVMGTPQYMSPEQALGAKEIDHRADLYALAVLLFECLTGTLPFEAESELSLIQMQAHAAAPDVRERAPWVPATVAEVVKRALAKRPEDRYASAGELLAALEEAHGGSGAAAALASAAAPAPAVAAPGAVLLAGASPATQLSMKQLARSGPATPPGAAAAPQSAAAPREQPGLRTSELQRQVRRRKAPAFIAVGILLILVSGGYLTFGSWLSRSAADQAVSEERAPGRPAPRAGSTGDQLALFDAGLDLREQPAAKPQTDRATLASAGEPSADRAHAAPSTEESAVQGTTSAPDEARVSKPFTSKPVARGSGTLNLISTLQGEPYWASVSVDGVLKGNTPLLLDLPAGKHRVRFERTGFRPVSKQVQIASGRMRVLRVELIP